ncbi:MAG: MliC family protein [Kovacikia sp.]
MATSTGLTAFSLPALSQPVSEPSPQPTASPSMPSESAPGQSSPAQPTTTPPRATNSVHYKCDNEKGFKAVFLSNQTVRTTFGSKVLVLPQIESGSGFRYSDGSVTLVGKGNAASVEVGEKVLFNNCVAGSSVQGLW